MLKDKVAIIDKELRYKGIKSCVVCSSATKTEGEVESGRSEEEVANSSWENAEDVAQGIVYVCSGENTVWEIRMR